VTIAAELENLTIAGELSGGISRLKGESVDFLTTPFTLENGNLFITLGIAGIVGLTYSSDQEIRDGFNRSKRSSFDKGADIGSTVGNPFLHLGAAALLYGGAIAADSAKWKEIGEMLGEALILADASTLIIKQAGGRGRPVASTSKSDFKPFAFKNDYDSFPSMHTASSFAMASVLAATSENFITKLSAYSAATFVGLSRIYQNKHWASDVLLAAAIGELSGRVVTGYHVNSQRHRLTLAPQAYIDGGGLMVVGKW
jgi:membrane-associated phospholipid phosphatase